uniref:Putative ABC-type sugar transport system, permease component n=1 Tax=uncultured bacterium Contigcl_1764b TaxID=1393658 RepID=W0FRD8_9BACT|nr:putative ABC-type sugar transport system, permease component [uncultured bacterium Contigcl_1764b]
MSEINTVKSSGTLQLINGKKYRGELVAGETGAAFYTKGQKEPMVEWHYARMNRMDNIRRGGTTSQVTVILKDDSRYVFELAQGLKLYGHMDKNWVDKPVRAKTRGDILHEQAERLGQKIEVPKKHLITRRHPNRSIGGDIGIYFLLLLFGIAMIFPLVYLVGSSLKPLDELFRFPPPVWPSHPTMDNFSDLFVTMGQSWVPFSRYLVNTVFITVVGTFGHLVIAGMAAFVLAKYEFPGGRFFFGVVTTCLMFSGYVTGIPNYLIMSRLGMVDTYWALVLPAFAAPIGLFLMKQTMEGLPTALIEAATIDGASRFRIFWSIVMPNVKPAWITMIIFSVQSLWNTSAATVIYSEAKKTLVYALQQIQAGGIARTGQMAAANVIIVAVPILIFIFSQSRILETMASSGIKD